MIKNAQNIAVVYLAWLPYPIIYFEQFIDSYKKYDSGCQHDVILVFNGVSKSNEYLIDNYFAFAQQNGVTIQHHFIYTSGQDIEVYKKTAAQLSHDYILFLNTYSTFNNENWLLNFVKNIDESIGLIGATASNASYISSINKKFLFDLLNSNSIKKKCNLFKYVLKVNILNRHKFVRPPNPHIRTNAFFIEKNLFLGLNFPVFNSKMDAYIFENGKESMTNQIYRIKKDCLLIDKFGNATTKNEWANQKIFWQSNQEALLVNDNQTAKYHNAPIELKNRLNKEAWPQ